LDLTLLHVGMTRSILAMLMPITPSPFGLVPLPVNAGPRLIASLGMLEVFPAVGGFPR
jgi:hypothetical protein